MNKDPKISNIQIRALLISTLLGVGVLSLPNGLANEMDKDGWIAIIIATILTIPLLIIMNKIFEYNSEKDFFEIGNQALGEPIFTVCLIIYLAYYIAISASIVRLLGDIIKGFLLTNTPIQVIVFLFILSVSYVAISEIDIIARISYLTYPLEIGFVVLLILLSLPDVDFTDLLPLFQSDISNLPKGLSVTLFSFIGFEILLFAIPYAEDKKRVLKTSISAIIIVGVIYLLIFLATLTRLSLQHIKSDPYPVLMIAKLIDLPGYFLQNLDGFVTAIWVIVIFSTLAPVAYSSGKILSKLFKTKSHKIFILMLIPIVHLVAFIPKSVVELNEIMAVIINYLSVFVVFIIPLVILVVGRIRGRKNK
jgi:spore germination protein